VKLSFTWLGVRKTLAPEQRTTAARAFQADRDLLSASKLIFDTRNSTYRNVARVRSEASGYWRLETLPFPEPGVRLLQQNKLTQFDARMVQYRQELQSAASELASQYDQIKAEAQRRLGTLFNASDYPQTLDGLFDLEVTYPAIEPPNYLMALHPDVYQAEQARVRERFESAVELAEQAFATELQRLTAHLAERLTGPHDGQPKVFRDSAVENLREFFERFRRLNIRSSSELDMLVEEAQQVITGIEPQQLRDSVRLRQMVARVLSRFRPVSEKCSSIGPAGIFSGVGMWEVPYEFGDGVGRRCWRRCSVHLWRRVGPAGDREVADHPGEPCRAR